LYFNPCDYLYQLYRLLLAIDMYDTPYKIGKRRMIFFKAHPKDGKPTMTHETSTRRTNTNTNTAVRKWITQVRVRVRCMKVYIPSTPSLLLAIYYYVSVKLVISRIMIIKCSYHLPQMHFYFGFPPQLLFLSLHIHTAAGQCTGCNCYVTQIIVSSNHQWPVSRDLLFGPCRETSNVAPIPNTPFSCCYRNVFHEF